MLDEYKDIIKNNKFRFDNYRVACKELGEKVRNGTSKNPSLKIGTDTSPFTRTGTP